MEQMSTVVIAWQWLKMATVAKTALVTGKTTFEASFYVTYNSPEYTVHWSFTNIGDGTAYNAYYSLSNLDSSYCTITDNNLTSSLFNLGAGSSKDLYFNFSVNSSPPDGIFNFRFYLDYEDSAGHSYNTKYFSFGVVQ